MVEKNVKAGYSALWTDKGTLETASAEAKKKGEEFTEADAEPVLLFDLDWTLDELYVDNSGKCFINATGDTPIGNLSISIPVTNNLARDLVDVYLKRVNRVKTILEAAGKLEDDN